MRPISRLRAEAGGQVCKPRMSSSRNSPPVEARPSRVCARLDGGSSNRLTTLSIGWTWNGKPFPNSRKNLAEVKFRALLHCCRSALHIIDGASSMMSRGGNGGFSRTCSRHEQGNQPWLSRCRIARLMPVGKIEVLTATGCHREKNRSSEPCRSGAVNQDLEETWRRIRRLKA